MTKMIYVLVRFTGYNYFGSFHRLYIQADITGIVGQALGQVVSKCEQMHHSSRILRGTTGPACHVGIVVGGGVKRASRKDRRSSCTF